MHVRRPDMWSCHTVLGHLVRVGAVAIRNMPVPERGQIALAWRRRLRVRFPDPVCPATSDSPGMLGIAEIVLPKHALLL
jgi:hypothetical protein